VAARRNRWTTVDREVNRIISRREWLGLSRVVGAAACLAVLLSCGGERPVTLPVPPPVQQEMLITGATVPGMTFRPPPAPCQPAAGDAGPYLNTRMKVLFAGPAPLTLVSWAAGAGISAAVLWMVALIESLALDEERRTIWMGASSVMCSSCATGRASVDLASGSAPTKPASLKIRGAAGQQSP
jgi:hypothetical protein